MNDLPDILYRFLFIDWQSLAAMRLDKLGEVCSRAFILARGSDVAIPVGTVRQLHELGERVHWMVVETAEPAHAAAVAGYEIGLIDAKTDLHTEFAFSPAWPGIDALLPVLEARRRVVRVIGIRPETVVNPDNLSPFEATWSDDETGEVFDALQLRVYEELAHDVVQQLMRQGERPAEVATLVKLISDHNPEFGQNGSVEGIVQAMQRMEHIALENGRVTYRF